MIEWLVFVAVSAGTAAFIAWPRAQDAARSSRPEAEELRSERRAILAELREIEDDVLAGRIAAEDRADARRALAPQLRRVTEALSALGEERDG